MSTNEETEVAERILPPRLRDSAIALPSDPTEEELTRDWSLSEDDQAQVLSCRGEANRLRFAVQLCTLRNYGRFLDEYAAVPARIINYLGRQLRLPPLLFLYSPDRAATETGHQQRIREYLGYRSFDEGAQEQLKRWLHAQAAQGPHPLELYYRAEDMLRLWKVVLPMPSTLERVVSSVCARAREGVFERVADRLTPEVRRAIDDLLEVPPGDQRSSFFRLKAYPPKASAPVINTYVERYQRLRSMGVGQIDLSGIGPGVLQHLSQLARRYDARALKRFPPAKRYALCACFLVEVQKTLLDHGVALHDQYLMEICRKSRNRFEKRHRQLRRRAKKGVETLIKTTKALLAHRQASEGSISTWLQGLDEPSLQEAIESCEEFRRLEERGYVDELRARYSPLRRYLPTFLKLPFCGEPGNESLLAGIDLVRKLDAGELKKLPEDAPTDWVPPAFEVALRDEDGVIDRRTWEIGLSLAIREALRSGDLYLAESRRHVSFWNLVYDENRWNQERENAYRELSLVRQPNGIPEELKQEFDSVARRAAQGLDHNPFATIHKDRLKLKREDALEVHQRVKELQRVIETHLPRVRIEDLLMEVDSWCGFSREFRPLGSSQPRSERFYATLLAALIAHGTNLGISTMSYSTEGISVEMLQHLSKWFLREETLKAANAVLVNYHHGLELSSVWGKGISSSSDGQRFGLRASSLLGSYYPRYFGYYDQAVTIYTHLSDQNSVYSTQVISCLTREAPYVLEGLMENNTILRPKEHYTDTHGYTEQLFGLCYLLGYSFMPRIKDLKDQQLYRIDRSISYGPLDPLFRATEDTELVGEQWDQLVRVAASLRNRTAPAHVVLQRLASSSPSDRLAKALTALGRIVKTIYILRYIHEEPLRRRVQLQLNRGEFRHKLARYLFFARQGEFHTGDYVEIMNKASCLSLLSNAVLVWNTVQMGRIVEELRAGGESIADQDLALISPLAHAHVIPNGTYLFDKAFRKN